ncbi:MAG: outer membrane beta-barrel protein [Planctomycetota bacterium]
MAGAGGPFTHVGGIARLDLNEHLGVSGGLFLGWDVWDDDHDALTPYAGFSWSPSDRDALTANLIVGAERPQDDDDLRSVLDVTWTREWDACWQSALNVDVGLEQGAAGGDDATWWGAAGYLTRRVTPCLSATARGELFRDVDGTRLGQRASLGGVTFGLDWTPKTPFPIFHIRPEIRWDHSFEGALFDGGSSHDQLTFTVECIIGF